MIRKVLFITAVSLLAVALAFGQTVTLTPYGVSPRYAESDTLDMFDHGYSGMLNVGVETQMYFKVMLDGAALSSPTWTVTQAPASSTADFGTPETINDSTQIVDFATDLEGTYVIQFSDGSLSATLTINAGLYMGIEDGNCGTCHSGKVSEWQNTGHASMLERGLEGTLSNHYASYCIGCHTVGYDTNADNNGFDDRTFVFPDTLFPGMYDSMKTAYPDAMKLANIQCESCHGPGSAHFGNTADSKMEVSWDSKTCAVCHDEGDHHGFPAQYDLSVHANPQHPYTRSSCAPCHNGAGFVEFVNSNKTGLDGDMPMNVDITCASCHDPHSDENAHQLRTLEVTLGDGTEIEGGGNGQLCMNCHKSRRNAADYTGPDFKYSSHYGPHHGPQADMLVAENVPTFGKELPSSAHFAATENACVDCHMQGGVFNDDHSIRTVGNHTFSMVDTSGADNVAACEGCHGAIGASFGDKKYYYEGTADHDGDGVEEGLQHEVEGMLEELALMLPPLDDPDVDVGGDYIYTESEAKAAYNYFFVEEDRSMGVHNPAFAVALLKISMEALENNAVDGSIVSIQDVPNDQGKQVTIIWNKFIDDGVAADPIQSYTVKRFDGDTTVWTGVGEHTADGSDRYALVVPTLFDSTADHNGMTEFMVVAISASGETYESEPVAGYSVDNLIPQAPMNPQALVANDHVNLSWEATSDPDINFYRIYRSDVAGFIPADDLEIGTTAGLDFVDNTVTAGTYYYQIKAVDFSGNLGVSSAEVSANVTAIGDDQAIPLEFKLAQNYPNPFNPTTRIDFALKTSGQVKMDVYNAVGQNVATLVDKQLSAGNYSVNFDGAGLSSGIYFYRLHVMGDNGEQFLSIQKMILMK